MNIERPTAILGPGAELLTIDAGGESRVFSATGAQAVWLQGITLDGGFSDTDDGGGGIRAFETNLDVAEMVIQNCDAWTGAGIWIQGGDLAVTGSTFSGNSTTHRGWGGAIHAARHWALYGFESCQIIDCQFSGNSADGSSDEGGAVCSSFPYLTIRNSSFHGNSAEYGGRRLDFFRYGDRELGVFGEHGVRRWGLAYRGRRHRDELHPRGQRRRHWRSSI